MGHPGHPLPRTSSGRRKYSQYAVSSPLSQRFRYGLFYNFTNSLFENLDVRDYDPMDFLRHYVAFMKNPESHNDSYADLYHRQFFAKPRQRPSLGPRNLEEEE